MKKGKQQLITVLIACILVLIASTVKGQVQIDKPLQLTGTGLDARVMGIDTVADKDDAISVEMQLRNIANQVEQVWPVVECQYSLSHKFYSGKPIKGMKITFQALGGCQEDMTDTTGAKDPFIIFNGYKHPIRWMVGVPTPSQDELTIVHDNYYEAIYNTSGGYTDYWQLLGAQYSVLH